MKTPPRKPQPDWSVLDWSHTNTQLAHTVGLSVTTVWRQRQKHAPKTASMKGRCGRKATHYDADWPTLDWSLTNVALSQLIGCAAIRIWRMRMQFAPHTCTMKGRCGRKPATIPPGTDWSQSTSQLKAATAYSTATVHKYRHLHAPHTVRHRIDWSQVDWTEPRDTLLAKLKCTSGSLYNARCRLKIDKRTKHLKLKP